MVSGRVKKEVECRPTSWCARFFFLGLLGLFVAFLSLIDVMHQSLAVPLATPNRRRLIGPNDIDCSTVGFPGKVITAPHQYHPHDKSLASKSHPSCRSKYEQHCFWRASNYTPSTPFLAALRDYEALHQRCVHGHDLTKMLLEGRAPDGCQYVVWKNLDGKGNQLISLVSAFVYSLITKRALLITPEASLQHLLCEPFPDSSWLVPQGFPEAAVREQSEIHGLFYDRALNLLKENGTTEDTNGGKIFNTPKHLVTKLSNLSPKQDLRFFCPAEQKLLSRIPWLLFWSNQYSVPGLYFLPDFREALNRLFPDRAVFLHAGRYLLSPNNEIWGRITRFYDAYLAVADRRLGIQVRTWRNDYLPMVSMHIFKCATIKGLLPNLTTSESLALPATKDLEKADLPPDKVAVLVTALRREYHENLTEMYIKYPTVEGSQVKVVSPSFEGKQQTGKVDHEKKVLADMWLLSFMDDVISTPRSTFGHVAHGLAGITPTVFLQYGLNEEKLPDPLCSRTNLPGPCFMDHPEEMPCPMDPPGIGVGNVDTTVPEVRHCLHQWGIGMYEN